MRFLSRLFSRSITTKTFRVMMRATIPTEFRIAMSQLLTQKVEGVRCVEHRRLAKVTTIVTSEYIDLKVEACCVSALSEAEMVVRKTAAPEGRDNFAGAETGPEIKGAVGDAERFVQTPIGRRVGAVVTKADKPWRVEIYRHWETKDSVSGLDISGIRGILARVAREVQARGTFQPCNLSVNGYDDDSRELYQIPEVRKWAATVFEAARVLPILLSEDTVQWFVTALVDVEVFGEENRSLKLSVSAEDVMEVVLKAEQAGWKFFRESGLKEPKDLMEECMGRTVRGLGLQVG